MLGAQLDGAYRQTAERQQDLGLDQTGGSATSQTPQHRPTYASGLHGEPEPVVITTPAVDQRPVRRTR